MKFILVFSLILSLFACKTKPEVQYEAARFDTSGVVSVFYMTDPKKILFSVMPARRIVRHYMAQDGLDSTSVPGRYIIKFRPITDSIYMIATTDSSVVLKDSAGRDILDSATKKVQYLPSFKKPVMAPKIIVTETQIITFPNIK